MLLNAVAAIIILCILVPPVFAVEAGPGAGERFSQALSDYEAGRFELASAGARETARIFPGGVWEGRALFVAARADAARGELDSAADAFGLARGRLPLLADYADFLLAGAYMEAEMYDEAAGLYLRAAEARPSGPLVEDSLAGAGRALVEQGRFDEAASTLDRLLGMKPGRKLASEALFLLMKAEAGRGRNEAALGRYRKLWLDQPGTYLEREAGALLDELSKAGTALPGPDANDYLDRAERLSDLGLFGRAAEQYEEALRLMPDGHRKRGEAMLGLGYSQYKSRNNDAATTTLRRLVDGGRYPSQAPVALYWLARTYLRTGQDKEFRAAARRCADEYPGAERAADCLYVLGVELSFEKMYAEAVEVFNQLLNRHPHPEVASDALWRLGWAEFSRGGYIEAETAFRRLYENYPNTSHAARGKYWLARTLEKVGDAEGSEALYAELAENYRLSFYALLAKSPGMDIKPGGALKMRGKTVPERSGQYPEKAFKRAAELGILGLEEFGVRELVRVAARYSGSPAGLEKIAAAYGALGEHKRPLEIASRLYRTRMKTGKSPVLEDVMRIIFPAAFWDVISREAAEYNVDPFLVASLVREESHFDPEVQSPAGAVGLMQLMPETAAMVCRKLGRPSPSGEGLKRGDYNVPLGVCHLAYLLEKHDGRLAYVLCEYNAGPSALARWKQRWPDAPDDEFIENIGYPETRNYVRNVLRNYNVYRDLYGSR